MKTQTLFIPHRLPGLNEIVAADRSHKMQGAKQKAYWTGIVKMLANPLEPVIGQAHFRFTWYEKNRRRDPDNISAGQKFVFDGLKEAGILENDGWKQIASLHHDFEINPTEGVKMEIWEA